MSTICKASSAWGCFPGLAPDPRQVQGAPVRYPCLLEANHEGDHEMEVAGKRVKRPRPAK